MAEVNETVGGVGLNVLESIDSDASSIASPVGNKEDLRTSHYKSLGLLSTGGSVINDSNEPSYIVNARRVIINSQSDPTMICGSEGVAITSPKQVSIDSDDRVILHGLEGVYLGIPNKGNEIPDQLAATIENKKGVSPDYNYEPLVLGLKLQDLLEELVQVIKNITVKCPGGEGYIREDAQWDLLDIQSRLPEILSTYAYVDGYSHPPRETLSQARPTQYDSEDIADTGTTTGESGTANTPASTTAAAGSAANTSNLQNYKQSTTVNATVSNNKVTVK